jgi:replicative DNA helicase
MIPPHNIEAEAAVLSNVILDPDALLPIAREILLPRDFFSRAHSLVYAAILKLADEGRAIDAVTVATQLRDNGDLRQSGGLPYVMEILNAAPACIERHLREHCATVANYSKARRLIRPLRRALAELRHGEDAADVLVKMTSKIDSIVARGAT